MWALGVTGARAGLQADAFTTPSLAPPRLPQRGYKVRALSRSSDKVQQLFRGAEGLSTAIADLREPSSLPAALEGVDAVVCATGTTAFPSKRCAAAAAVGHRGGKLCGAQRRSS